MKVISERLLDPRMESLNKFGGGGGGNPIKNKNRNRPDLPKLAQGCTHICILKDTHPEHNVLIASTNSSF